MLVQQELCYRRGLYFTVSIQKYTVHTKYYNRSSSNKNIRYEKLVIKSELSKVRIILYIAHILWGHEHATDIDGVNSLS
jgi:hypothetical protein